MNLLHDLGYEPDDLMVKVSEMLVATSDASDELIDESVPEVLRLLRERMNMNMEVVFVSEFTDGQRVFRHVAVSPGHQGITVGGTDPLEESWCQRVVDGRLPQYIPDASQHPVSAALSKKLPFPIGIYISTPVVLKSGQVYGILCCFSFSPHSEPNPADLQRLQYTAQLTADRIERNRSSAAVATVPDLALLPK